MTTSFDDALKAVQCPPVVCFDGESNGLHGEVFAVGAVLLAPNGSELATFYARAPISVPVDPWVAEHVLPALSDAPETHESVRAMRDAFWAWLTERPEGSLVLVDVGWPVEAGLLSACVADDPRRAWLGPYPMHDVASLLLAAGLDPSSRTRVGCFRRASCSRTDRTTPSTTPASRRAAAAWRSAITRSTPPAPRDSVRA